MEEACEAHRQPDRVLSDKNNKKRQLKTPSQVAALEKLYSEQKYPTESMKAQLAEEQGMTEKQVSGWFCHRRLKDKNMLKDEMYANGRQDLSSGIVQDRGSALKQDSCSSTKQGDYRHSDIREVESQRLYGHDYPAVDLTYGHKNQYMHSRNYSAVEDASSDSSSASHGGIYPQPMDPYDSKPLTFSPQHSNYNSLNNKTSKNRVRSGYFNSQVEIERDAISSVKRQLGRHYRKDGPPLGVNFESLPPGAFDSPIRDAIDETYYVDDPLVHNSLSAPRASKQSTLQTSYNGYNDTRYPQNSYPKGALLKRARSESSQLNEYQSQGSERKSSFTNHSSNYLDRFSRMDNIVEDPAGKSSVLNRSRNHELMVKHEEEEMRAASVTNYSLHPYAGKVVKSESPSYLRLHNEDDTISHLLRRGEYLDGRPSKVKVQSSGLLLPNDREHTRRIPKEENIYQERQKNKKCVPGKAKMQLKEEIRRGKRMHGEEYLPHSFASKSPSPQVSLPWEPQTKGHVAEVPTSFSEDETATSSSSTN